jgi:virulence-associated protein VapD
MVVCDDVPRTSQSRIPCLYLTDKDDLANLFAAIMALKRLPWFPGSVRDIRAFKVEHWSDFTRLVKEP